VLVISELSGPGRVVVVATAGEAFALLFALAFAVSDV